MDIVVDKYRITTNTEDVGTILDTTTDISLPFGTRPHHPRALSDRLFVFLDGQSLCLYDLANQSIIKTRAFFSLPHDVAIDGRRVVVSFPHPTVSRTFSWGPSCATPRIVGTEGHLLYFKKGPSLICWSSLLSSGRQRNHVRGHTCSIWDHGVIGLRKRAIKMWRHGLIEYRTLTPPAGGKWVDLMAEKETAYAVLDHLDANTICSVSSEGDYRVRYAGKVGDKIRCARCTTSWALFTVKTAEHCRFLLTTMNESWALPIPDNLSRLKWRERHLPTSFGLTEQGLFNIQDGETRVFDRQSQRFIPTDLSPTNQLVLVDGPLPHTSYLPTLEGADLVVIQDQFVAVARDKKVTLFTFQGEQILQLGLTSCPTTLAIWSDHLAVTTTGSTEVQTLPLPQRNTPNH